MIGLLLKSTPFGKVLFACHWDIYFICAAVVPLSCSTPFVLVFYVIVSVLVREIRALV